MSDAPAKRKRMFPEAWRQEKAAVFARDAITCPHTFMAFDRSQARGQHSHLFEAQRGIRVSMPDTLLIARITDGNTRHVWAEWKAPGKKPNDGQYEALERLRGLGDSATWCETIEEYRLFLAHVGIPMVPNAEYRAMVLDGFVDSRIAKAEGKMPGVAKKPRASRTTAGKPMPMRQYRRAHARGLV